VGWAGITSGKGSYRSDLKRPIFDRPICDYDRSKDKVRGKKRK
jgi:hypothetical protein